MKKIVIPVAVFMVFIIAGIVFTISLSYAQVEYDKATLVHKLDASRGGGELLAEYMGQKTRVAILNLDRVEWLVTISERRRLFFRPKYDAETAVYLHFSDGAEYIVAENPNEEDSVFVLYGYQNKNLYFSITGYSAMSWAVRVVSPEGIYSTNEVIEEDEGQ